MVDFHSLYDSILHGNEIEFQYNEQAYYLLPVFKGQTVVGVALGKFYAENEMILKTEQDLYNASIDDTTFGKAFSEIVISWNNFDWT